MINIILLLYILFRLNAPRWCFMLLSINYVVHLYYWMRDD